MEASHAILIFMAMLLVAILVEPLAARIRLPFSAALVLSGFLMSEMIVAAGMDTGLRWYNFQTIIFYVLIPALVFESAFRIRFNALLQDIVSIVMLAVPLMLVSTGIIAIVLFYTINHPAGFPWIAALITGAVLSATDPDPVLSIVKQNRVSERLSLLLEGESMFNDATAIVLFSLLLSVAMSQSGETQIATGEWTVVIGRFFLIFLGGVVTGLAVGSLAWIFANWYPHPVKTSVITIVSAYLSYLIAEDVLNLSGVMSVLSCGMVFGEGLCRNEESGTYVFPLWDVIGYITTAVLFLLAGFTINLDMFASHWLAILFGIVAVILARVFCIYGLLPIVDTLPRTGSLSGWHRFFMTIGGVRGTVTLALALSLPVELGYWYSVQSIAYGVVVFNIFIQTPAMSWLIKKHLEKSE